jgi:hypothetical protein
MKTRNKSLREDTKFFAQTVPEVEVEVDLSTILK